MKYGYNVDVDSVPLDKAVVDMKASGSPIHVLMTATGNGIATQNNLDQIWRYHNALYPVYGDDLVLIWRWYSPREGNWTQYPDAKVYQTILEAWDLPPSVMFDSVSNEPSLNANSYMTNEAYVRHERQMLESISKTGIRYGVGAFGVGHPHEQMIADGVYDDLFRDVLEYNGFISMHLYGVFPFETGETESWDLMLPTEENKEWIRDRYLHNQVKWPASDAYRGWLIGRARWIEERCKTIDIETPDMYITEGFFDRIGSMPDHVNSAWRDFNGIRIYNYDNRGILTWERYFKWLFPELAFEDAIQMMMVYLEKNVLYQPYIKAMTLFGYNRQWGYPSGSHKESGHNWEDPKLKSFRDANMFVVNTMVNDDDYTQPIPTPSPEPDLELPEIINKTGMLSSTHFSYVRSSTEITDNVAFELTDTPIHVTLISKNHLGDGNDYKWHKFEYDFGVYFVADTGRIDFVEDVVVEDTQYVFDVLEATHTMSLPEVKDLIDVFDELIDLMVVVHQTEDKELVLSIFREFLELVNEASQANKEKSIQFLELILEKLKEIERKLDV